MWRTRKHGSKRQKGKRFLVSERKPRYKRVKPRGTVKVVSYSPGRIEVEVAGDMVANSIEVLPHVVWAGSWDRGRSVIYIDDDVPPQWRKYLALHETLEKYFAEKGLDPNVEAHEKAEALEKRVFLNERSAAEWDEYMQVMDRIHRREYEKVHGAQDLAR